MKNIKLLPNIAGFGLAATTTITGIALEKLPITLTGINTGILVSAINFTNKKSQLQQQDDSASIAIDYLTKQIKTIQQETQKQQQKFNQYQQDIYDFKSQQSQTIQQHNYLGNQFNNLITNLENSNNNLKVLQKQQQQTIQEQKQLSFALGNAQNQLNSHNKKLKKQQHEINTHKTNQNKVTSELQKIKNQQKTMAATQTQHLGKIEAQVDTLIQIAQNNSSQSVSPSKTTLQKKVTAPISRKPQTLSYIDNNNFFNCFKEMSIEPDYKSLLVYLTSKIGKTQIKLYDGAFSQLTAYQQRKYSLLKQLGYQVFTFPIAKRAQGKFKTVGDDVQLAIDMVKDVRAGDSVILITGDGDLYPAVKEIKQRNVHVTVIAKNSSINDNLRNLADDFISLDSLKYDLAKHTKLSA